MRLLLPVGLENLVLPVGPGTVSPTPPAQGAPDARPCCAPWHCPARPAPRRRASGGSEKVSKVKINTGASEKVHASSSQGGVIFKTGTKSSACVWKRLFPSFLSFFPAGTGAAAPAELAAGSQRGARLLPPLRASLPLTNSAGQINIFPLGSDDKPVHLG